MNKDEREFIQPTKKELELLRQMVAPNIKKCHYCKKKIDFQNENYSIFNKPTRLICSSILCLTEAITEDET